MIDLYENVAQRAHDLIELAEYMESIGESDLAETMRFEAEEIAEAA